MADDKIRIPSGGGGLTRFSEDTGSKVELSPGAVIIMAIVIVIIIALLHYLGGKFLA
ncbi:MAG TPA: preprotein translocase subunit Sec61beta [Candidatus Nanoarchaeia archaeon]|nr:preprotein translocase subunit Sec61beta [Candidatus Nanoarchaeia archaeon]